MSSRDVFPGVAAIVARIPVGLASREMAEAFRAEVPALEQLPEDSQDDIVQGVRRNLRRWWRWLATGMAPPDGDFDPLREWARARAAEGVRLEDLLRAFGVGRQIGWELIRRHARAQETGALLDAAGLLMRYVDRVCAGVTDTYLAERDALVSEEERRTRDLVERLGSGGPLDHRGLELAERLGVAVESAYAPFVVVLPGHPPRRHAALAARMRRRGWPLTVTDGGRVVGLSGRPLDVGDLDEGPDVILAVAGPTSGDELAAVREDLRRLAEHARRTGSRGRIRADDHLMEIIMGRAPGPAERLRARVLAPLSDPEHEDLLRTLRAFVAHDYNHAATGEALHIHRNTVSYRLRRIEELTGLDLASARDLAATYLAVGFVRMHSGSGPDSSDRR